jgi:hypothetical protein
MAVTDDATDRSLSSDQNGLDIATILVGDEIRRETGPAGKVDGFDIVSRIIEQVVVLTADGFETGLDQCEIGIV